jgi:hypothetical protein
MVEHLFDEYAASFARGESPDVRAYLALAGAEAAELARLIEAFAARVEPPEPDEGQVALAAAWIEGTSPLEELCTRRGLQLDDLVAALVGALRLDPSGAPKVKRYVSRLASGTLSRRGVDRRVWTVWAETLRTTPDALKAWRPRPLPPAPAQMAFRASAPMAAPAPAMELAAAKSVAQPPEPDEVDRLFLHGG